MKPKITKFSQAWWRCEGNGLSGYGITIDAAYKNWSKLYVRNNNQKEERQEWQTMIVKLAAYVINTT
jgi:hypothetical protein